MAARKGARTTPRNEPIPDALGDASRVDLIVNQLTDLQASRFRLDLQQEANNHTDDEPVAGLAPDADGNIVTYAQRRELLKNAEQRIADAHPKLMPAVRAKLRAREDG